MGHMQRVRFGPTMDNNIIAYRNSYQNVFSEGLCHSAQKDRFRGSAWK